MKPLNALQFSQLAEQVNNRWHVKIDPKAHPIEDVFRPQFWVHGSRLADGDLIRVQAADDSYDFQLKVSIRIVHGKQAIRVGLWPNLPEYVVEAADASTEMIPMTVSGKPVPRVEYVEADQWRVIGFDGGVHSRSHSNEAAAKLALAALISAYGYTSVADRDPVDLRTGEARKPLPHDTLRPPAVVTAATVAENTNMSLAKRKEAAKKAEKTARVASDMEALKEWKAREEAAR